MAKFVVSIRDFVSHQQKEQRKPFIMVSSELMINPLYSIYIKTGYWQGDIMSRQQFLKAIPEFDLADVSVVTTTDSAMMVQKNLNKESVDDIDLLVGYISEEFVKNIKRKVVRLRKHIRQGFDSEESRLVKSESSNAVHSITCTKTRGVRYVCDCQTCKSFEVCAHSLAAALDNRLMTAFINSLISNGSKRITPLATARSSSNAGRKASKQPRKRKPCVTDNGYHKKQFKLSDALKDIEADEVPSPFNVANGSGLKLTFLRANTGKTPKPKVHPTTSTPFEIIDIKGNISKCAGCHGNLKDGPVDSAFHELDKKICIRHKEIDDVWIDQRSQWVQKFDNKHFHVNRNCIILRNPHFQPNNIDVVLEVQPMNHNFKAFVKERLY